jgi:rhodanese-related sulfurtransferase
MTTKSRRNRSYAFLGLFVLLGCSSGDSKSDKQPDGSIDAGRDSQLLGDLAEETGAKTDAGVDAVSSSPDVGLADRWNDVGRDVGTPTDLRLADLAPTTDATATEVLAADKPSTETSAVDKPTAETSVADKPTAEVPTSDGLAGDGGCTGWNSLKRLSPAEAADLIATSDPIVINVHIPYAGDIPGTDTSIPYNDVDAIEAYLHNDLCAEILLVCHSGGMSLSAGNELIKRGYLRVRDLNGGMVAWEAAGYALLKDGGP